MTTLPTYNEQFNKITEAYIKGEIQPMDERFCFCGTLAGNSREWAGRSYETNKDFGNYLGTEYSRMESALLKTVYSECDNRSYEDRLFSGMCAALEVLKQIHIERGEIIDDAPVFKKRTIALTKHHTNQ